MAFRRNNNDEEVFTQMAGDIKRCYDEEKRDVASLTEFVRIQGTEISDLKTKIANIKVDNSNEDMMAIVEVVEKRVESLEGKFKKVIEVSNKLFELLNKLAIEKQLIEVPKPKTPIEQMEEVKEEMKEFTLENKEEGSEKTYRLPAGIIGICRKCNIEQELNDVTISDTRTGPMYRTVCKKCGTGIYRKAKIKDVEKLKNGI